MGSNRVFDRAVRVTLMLLASVLVFGACSLSQPTPAFADYAAGSLVAQDGGSNGALTESMIKEINLDGDSITQDSFVLKTDDDVQLVRDTDYIVRVDVLSSGVFKATISGKGAYAGSEEMVLYYKVETEGDQKVAKKKTLFTSADIKLSAEEYEYDGSEHKPDVTVTVGTENLVQGTDFTVSYTSTDLKGIGTKNVSITGTGDYISGSVSGTTTSISSITKTYRIGTKIDGAVFTVSNKTYTGNAPSFSSSDITGTIGSGESAKQLAYGTDFTASCSDVNAGTATVTIKGAGNYVGSAVRSFTIEPFDLGTSGASVTANFSIQTFTGSALTPKPSSASVYFYQSNPYLYISRTLTDADYDLTYSNNVNAGTATATFNGKGNFKGKTSKTFTINSANMSSTTVGAIAARTYTGSQLKSSVSSVKLGNYALQEGRDYTLSYGANKNAGTSAGSVTLTGKGNFTSTKTAYFDINAKSITSSDISVTGISNYSYTGSAITPSPTITDKTRNAKLAVYDSSKVAYLIGNNYYDSKYNVLYFDYETAYANNTNPGTATLTITGMGNYTGTRKVNFTITGTGTVPQVKATNKGNGQVSLEWGHIYNATKYMIQEKLPNGKYKTLSNSWTRNRCTITNLSATRNHRFLVRAFVDNKWSSNSDKHLVSIKPTGATKPTVRMYSAGKKAITLAWNAVPGTDRYAIYEKVGGQFQLLTSSYTSTTVTINKLKKKGKYTFAIRAYIDGKWSKVKKKDYVTVSPADPNPPTVTAVGGVGAGKVKLTWDKARNAKKYMVQVKLENGKWKTLTKKLKKRTYTASGLSSNREHTFRVRAYGNKKWSKTYSECYASATPDNA